MSDAKRQRPSSFRHSDSQWSICFPDCASLKSITDAARSVMQRMTIRVSREDDGAGNHVYVLRVDGADPSLSCVVSIRLLLEDSNVSVSQEVGSQFSFCLDCAQLLYSIEGSATTHSPVTMSGLAENARIAIRCKSSPDGACGDEEEGPSAGGAGDASPHLDESQLSTFETVHDEDTMLNEIDFDMLMEIDVSRMKEILKKAKKANAERLRIRIYQKNVGNKMASLVRFEVSGDTFHFQQFCNEVMRDESGSSVVRAAADGGVGFTKEGGKKVFDGTYPIVHIESFLRNMSKSMIVAKVKQDRPLLLTHTIGGSEDDASHIRFLVAPVDYDEDA